MDSTITGSSLGGIYCARCGAKTYLARDGSHRRCPSCDDIVTY